MSRSGIFVILAAVCVCLLVSCIKEDVSVDTGREGQLRISFSVPTSQMEWITRSSISDQLENRVEDLYLFLFKPDGTVATQRYFTRDQLQGVSEAPDVPFTTGSVTVATSEGARTLYVVANIGENQPLVNVTKAMLDGISSRQQLLDLMVSFKDGVKTVFRAGGGLLMTGVNTSVTVAGALTNASITLKRIDSKVEVEVNSGPGVAFSPVRWRVVNVPTKATLFENSALVNGVTTAEDFFTSDWNTFESSTATGQHFSYYQQENRKQPVTAISSATTDQAYRLREKRNNGKYVYAHPLSTYIEFEGDYEKTETDGKITYAKTRYLLHLGYTNSNANDFNCNRNVNYKYTVTINGVEDIRVEVMENNERNTGVTGDVTRTQSLITSDSHYSTYIIRFPQSTAGTFNFYVNTPFEQHGITDIGWVKFLKNPASAPNTVQEWNSSTMPNMMSVSQLRDQINTPANNSASYFNVSGYAYYTVFLNEFYYEKHPITNVANSGLWREFVNQPDREMVMSADKHVSADGESKYTESVFLIKQKSIRTFFDETSSSNAWGFEVKDETYGTTTYNSEIGIFQGNSDLFNGWFNTCKDCQFVNDPYLDSDWIRFANWCKWNSFVNKSSIVNGVYVLTSSGPDKPNLQTTNTGRYTCLSRNRDLDGDGQISPDELRWYTPAINQLVDIWIGAGRILPTDRLLDPSTPTNPYPKKHYLSSTILSGRSNPYILWAEEGSSIGPLNDDDIGRGNYTTRCLRNLGTVRPGALPEKYADVVNNVISLVNSPNKISKQAYRDRADYIYLGELPPNNELQVFNRPAKKMRIAKSDLPSTYTWARAVGQSAPCRSYFENSDQSDRGKWRVPNQCELQLILSNVIPVPSGNGNTMSEFYGVYWSATTCYYGGDYRAFVLEASSKLLTRRSKTDSYKIRCVRDWDNGFL